MARRSAVQYTCCLLILLTTFVPLPTEVTGGDPLSLMSAAVGVMHVIKAVVEFGVKESSSEVAVPKVMVLADEIKHTYEHYPDIVSQVGRVIGGGWNGTVVHYMRTGTDANRKFPVLAVDVTNMFSWTTSCDFSSPGLWLVSCNSPLCEQNAGGPPYCAASCHPSNTSWGLFNASLARYLEAAADPQQAQTPLWYLCVSMPLSSSDEGVGFPDAVLGLGRGPAGTLPAAFTTFSYLLTSDGQSSVWLGADSDAHAPEQVQPGHSTATTTTIQLISNPKHPELYYVHLKAIKVDGTELDLGHTGILELDPDTGDGGVFTSSTPVRPWTYLNRAAYEKLADKFKILLSPAEPLPGLEPDQLCYRDSSLAANTPMIPKLALVFDDGAVMELHMDNYWGQYINGSSQLQCFSGDGG